MDSVVLPLSLEGVEFRGEGNSGLVVALKNSAKVLKLKKTAVCNERHQHGKDWLALHRYQVAFMRNVAIPLLGSSLIDIPKIVRLHPDEIICLNNSVRKERATHRLKKALSPTLSCGLIFRDHCTIDSTDLKNSTEGPVVCIELKTKMGFMPNRCSPEQLKPQICRFHLVQNRKLRAGRIRNVSDYCPLDLFSGCPVRMEGAILKMLHNPQNNLRIFRDRQQVFGNEHNQSTLDLANFLHSSEDERMQLCCLILLALRKPLMDDRSHVLRGARPTIETRQCIYCANCSCDNEEQHDLPENSVLDRLLLCQQLFSQDVSTLHEMFLNQMTRPSSRFYEKVYPTAAIPADLANDSRECHESQEDFEHRMLWKCLVALTCRDCSIMITLQKLSNEWNGNLTDPNLQVIVFKDQKYVVSVGVIDLEPKTLDRIPKQFRDDTFMINNFSVEV